MTPTEQQFLINAIRFETSNLESEDVKKNVLTQLNKISNDIANRVATYLGMDELEPESTYYHDNTTVGLSTFRDSLPTIATLKVGILASSRSSESLEQAASLKESLEEHDLVVEVVGETLADGIDKTYSHAYATGFDGVIVTTGADSLFGNHASSPLYPAGRPMQVLMDAYKWGKPVGELGSSGRILANAGVNATEGVYSGELNDDFVESFGEGLATFRFTGRFPLDEGAEA